MKLKNTNIVEQHVEKMVIAIAALFALFVVVFYFLGSPYTVKLRAGGTEQNVTPDKVEDVMLSEVRQLKTALDSNRKPFEDIRVPGYTEEYQERLAQSVTPAKRYDMPLSVMGIDPAEVRIAPTQKPEYWVPPVPPVAKVKADSDYFVLAEPAGQTPAEVAKLLEAYETLIGKQRPRDFWAVRVAGVFDNAEWLKRLANPPIGADQKPMPEEWYKKFNYIVDVRLERQRWNEETGSWSDPTLIALLPQAPSFRNFTEVEDRETANVLRRELAVNQAAIRQAPFPPTVSKQWGERGVDLTGLSAAELATYRGVKETIERLKREIQNMERRIGGRGERGAPSREEYYDPDELEEFRDRPPALRDGRGEVSNPVLERKRAELREAEARRNALLGIDDEGAAEAEEGGIDGEFVEGEDGVEGVAEVDAITRRMDVRAFDLTVKPGETYRYRVVVDVYNPLFSHRDLREDQVEKYANLLKLRSEPSPWTEPVTIEQALRFFVTKAQPESARIELGKMVNGRRVSTTVDVRPGDHIVGEAWVDALGRQVSLKVPYALIDVVEGTATQERRVLLVNMNKGRIEQRRPSEDVSNNDRERFRFEQDQAGSVAAADQDRIER